jgi:hypothetical protein
MFSAHRRGRAARFGTVIMAIGALAAVTFPAASAATSRPASPSSTSATAPASHTTCVPNGQGTTCTGTASGDNAWNPWATSKTNPYGSQISQPPVVTVSQTKDLTDQVVNVNWQYFTPSLDVSGTPNQGPSSQEYEVTAYECKGADPAWNSNGLGDSCFESEEGVPGLGALGNALKAGDSTGGVTYAPGASHSPESWGGPPTATGGDPATWRGSAQFHVENGATNSFLGCDVHTPCSLVIIPNFGGDTINSENGPEDTGDCEKHDGDPYLTDPGSNNATGIDFACSYMDRIIIPLSFAPTPTDCPSSVIQNPAFRAEGSPMMALQMSQWQAAWCKGPAGSLSFASVPEDSARTAFLAGGSGVLGSGVDMALTTLPSAATSSRKFTYAPLANSGVAIAYYLDDAQPAGNSLSGQPVNRMVLDPRLVAKLTTESYALNYGCIYAPQPSPPWPTKPGQPSNTCDPAVEHNTPSLFQDQEFLSLNKDCEPATARENYVCTASDFPGQGGLSGTIGWGPFLPTMVGSDSDMTYQITDWVGDNADATAFLDGKSDPYGMHVNTYYKNTSYPSAQLSALDPGVSFPDPPGLQCVGAAGSCDALNDAGQADASMNVAWNFVDSLFDIAQNLLAFQPNAQEPTMQCQLGPSECTSITGFKHLNVPPQTPGSRALLSEMDLGDVGTYQFPAAALVNADGKAVAPTQASVEATVTKDMKTNPDGITQYVNQSSTDPADYPLTMVDYAMVPTCGLSHAKASAIADFLDDVATTGQKQGDLPGQLQPGYYSLTSAQRAQTLKAAQEVRTQDCKSAPPDHTVSGHNPSSDTAPSDGARPTASTPARDHRSPSANPSPIGHARTAAFGQKSADSGLAGILLVLAIVFGALLVVGGPTAWVITVTGRWPVVLRSVRTARSRSLRGLGRLAGLVARRA